MLESEIQERFRNFLRDRGWHTKKIHGGKYQHDLPDLLCMHKVFGTRWVEMKQPGEPLRPGQIKEFCIWWRYGVQVYIICGYDELDYQKLFKPCNLHSYIDGVY